MQTGKENKVNTGNNQGRELLLTADSGNTEEKMMNEIEEDSAEQTEEEEA